MLDQTWRKECYEDNEEVDYDDAQIPIHNGFGAFDDDTAMEEPEAYDAEYEPTDELGQVLCGEREDCESEKKAKVPADDRGPSQVVVPRM